MTSGDANRLRADSAAPLTPPEVFGTGYGYKRPIKLQGLSESSRRFYRPRKRRKNADAVTFRPRSGSVGFCPLGNVSGRERSGETSEIERSGGAVMEWLFIWMCVFGWILPSIAIGLWAESQGKTFSMGFLYSLFISPLVGAVIVASTRNKVEPSVRCEPMTH